MKALKALQTIYMLSVWVLEREGSWRKSIIFAIAFALLPIFSSNEAIATDTNGPSSTNVLCMDVDSFGAVGDGVTMNTVAIQKAINACPAGGLVWLHNGTFLSGTIILHSDMTLYIDPTATLLGSGSTNDYPVLNPAAKDTQQSCMVLVSAQSCSNLTITGGGIIDGNGRTNFPPDYVGLRPSPICTELCSNVNLQNFNIVDSAAWTVVNIQSDFLTISNVTINDDGLTPNRDGFDVVDCWNVMIENCTIDSGDDAVCLKSGSPRGVQNVQVQNCTITASGANGLKLGSASMGTFTHILFQDCIVKNTSLSAMAVESVDGSAITDLTFDNINFSGCQNAIFMILGSRDAGVEPGSIDGVKYLNITGSNLTQTYGCPISGTMMTNGVTYSLKNILFDNVNINFAGGLNSTRASPPEYAGQYPENTMWGVKMPAYGYYIRHATNVRFNHCCASASAADARPWIVTDDVSELTIPPPTLNILRNAGAEIVQWGNGSSLQVSTNYTGNFTDLIGAPSPYTNALPKMQQGFFRVRQ